MQDGVLPTLVVDAILPADTPRRTDGEVSVRSCIEVADADAIAPPLLLDALEDAIGYEVIYQPRRIAPLVEGSFQHSLGDLLGQSVSLAVRLDAVCGARSVVVGELSVIEEGVRLTAIVGGLPKVGSTALEFIAR